MGLIKFLGTAGARFVVAKQLRSSAGIYIETEGKRIILDPGPGTLVRMAKSRPKIDVMKIDGVILSHIHLDHSTDVNIIMDAFTQGGLNKRGALFTTNEALRGEKRVILPYLLSFLDRVDTFSHTEEFVWDKLRFQSFAHRHTTETYGIKFFAENKIISFIVDTLFFDELLDYYKGSNVVVMNVVRFTPMENVLHLSLGDVRKVANGIHPDKIIMTHFGMTMLRNKPFELAKKLSDELGMEIIAASDGMSLEF
jgi:phosphoribosyl 1,2-cyclic phosphodiesterase